MNNNFLLAGLFTVSTVFTFVVNTNRQISPVLAYQPSSSLIAQIQDSQEKVQRITTVGMTVSDMDKAIKFYSEVLLFRKISDVEVFGSEYEELQGVFGARMRIVQMQLGKEIITLTQYLTPKGKPIPVDSRSNDLWFQHLAIVVNDMDKAYERLRQFNVQHVSTSPQTLPDYIPEAAGVKAFYFQDPDGHNLEIIYFPPGKGDPRWQQPSDQLFLGIDHSAIAISNTEASLKFYRDLLGFQVAGGSENYGPQQERLNQVFGANLRITAITVNSHPGIEFLQYLTPPGGRKRPIDAKANDILHWETTMIVSNVEAMAQKLRAAGVQFVSSGIVTLPNNSLGFNKGFSVQDPDGHVIRIVGN